MKRNETVLVYAVTGLLLVILLVAVVFGSQPSNKVQPEREKSASLPGVKSALLDGEGIGKPASAAGDKTDVGTTDPGGIPAVVTENDPENGTEEEILEAGPMPPKKPETVPLRKDTNLPSARIERLFGASERQGEYRLVKAWRGASLPDVVERWVGDKDRLQDVLAVNETLTNDIAEGDEVLVPWVEDETLLAQHEKIQAERKRVDWAKGELYKLKKGDSLWKVASKRVPTNKIPAWLEQFKVLNPDISDLSALVEGQKVRLPR